MAVLATKLAQLLELQTRQPVLTTPLVSIRLAHPVADRRRGALELTGQLPGRAARANQSDAHTIWRRYSGAYGGCFFDIWTPPLRNVQVSTKPDQLHSERVETIGRLLPHLRHFVAVRHALLETRALGASLVELLDNVRAGVVQLDRRGRLVAVNDRALALLRRGDGLRDEGGRLRAALPGEDAALQGLIARALPSRDGPGVGGSMPLGRPEARSRPIAHVSPVHDAGIESAGVGALVLIVDPADRAAIDPGRVRKALGLTPAQSRVAVALAEGRTIDRIAAESGRSRNTVKWHIQHIYAELGVSRPIELAQLVASLADLPGARG